MDVPEQSTAGHQFLENAPDHSYSLHASVSPESDEGLDESTPTAAEHFAPTIPPTMPQSSKLQAAIGAAAGTRIFLDICSGAGHPLTVAMMHEHCVCLPVDKLLSNSMDLLDDVFFEQLLRICTSGIVSYAAASPNCGEYSRLRLRSGGPRALRTPEHLDGIPGLSATELEKVQTSHTIMARCVLCLELVYSAGGHCHLEQPTNSMAWLEPIVQRFIRFAAIYLVNFPACWYNRNWSKSWLLACSYPAMKSLAGKCQHPPGAHEHIAGVRLSDGSFKSRVTAEYPSEMCAAIAAIISPLMRSTSEQFLTLDLALSLIPVKGHHESPVSYEDGGGLFSEPDWSRPLRSSMDHLHDLRKAWVNQIIQKKLTKKLLAFLSSSSSDPPFGDSDLSFFRENLSQFITSKGKAVDWSIREDQPLHLGILHAISQILDDKDVHLFPMLHEGAPTGIDNNIPLSGCFPAALGKSDDSVPLSIHTCNWQSAESDIATTKELVQQEIDKGWVYQYPGTIAQAQEEFGDKLAVGRLGLALSDNRPPRLVVDSSICGLNSRCHIQERTTLPSALDVMRVYPLRQFPGNMLGFSMDIRSAHKLVVIKPSDRGLLGFSLEGRIYFYKVAPFGATFSAYHWTRLGSFILRFLHRLGWWPHAGFLYVDDFFFIFPEPVALIMATLFCITSLVVGLPLSWRKTELAPSVQWIGWRFHVLAGFVELPASKVQKLQDYLHSMLKSTRTSRRNLEKLLGLLNWVTQVFILMRCWLPILYRDLYQVPASHFSVNPGHWTELLQCLDENLKFIQSPQGTSIPVGSTLLAVRHQSVKNKQDLTTVYLSERRMWLRIRDPESSKRTLTPDSMRILRMYQYWLQSVSLVKCLRPKPLWTGYCAADACAFSDVCQIGGFINFPSGTTVWFSEKFTYDDFKALDIPVTQEMQKCIASFETLAQMAILFIFSRSSPGFRYPLRIPSLTDNSGTEAGGNKLFSTKSPMNLFLEKLTLLCTFSGMELDLSHISGERNTEADALSRWDFQSDPPFSHQLHNRFLLSLQQLWHPDSAVSLHPPDTFISWQLPHSCLSP